MRYHAVRENPHFIGREAYWKRLEEIDSRAAAAIIVIYGRRRVGKTELIEQFFRTRPLLKFEGLQPDKNVIRKSDAAEKRRQMTECLARLGRYLERPAEYRRMAVDRWSDFFELLVPILEKEPVVLYLEELQWMANYSDDLLSEFKPWWDDALRHNPRLRVVISGSSPSFIVNQFLASSAMYNRSNHMMKLEPFHLGEIQQFLGTGHRETMLAAIAIGGIPEYLKQIKPAASVYIGLCEKSFRPGEFLRVEKEKVFVSSLSANRFYEGIIDDLARRKSATRNELYKALTKGESAIPGGSFSVVLQELVELDFVERYVPVTTSIKRAMPATKPAESRHARYAIADEYLQFYYRFIDRHTADIDKGKYSRNPAQAINRHDFSKLMGFSFERWCRKNEYLIARRLGFGNVVEYAYGPWYQKDAVQIDLMFIRKDSKLILCEIKYNNESTLTRQVIRDMQQKVDLFLAGNPKYARYTVETALITTEPAPEPIRREGYFTYLVASEELVSLAGKAATLPIP
jgi:uncharacterized protein